MITVVIHLGALAFSTHLYTANLRGDGVTLEIGLTPDVDEWTSLSWKLTFDQEWREFPVQIRDAIFGTVNFEPLRDILNNSSNAEFWFGGCCTDMKIYIGKWGVHTGFIVELLYNPGEYGRWPNREELTSFLLDGKSPITNHQLAFVCEYETLNQFYTDLKRAVSKMQIGR